MSSHHIVKEKQEPALLILNIDDFEEEYLGQLLEWSPNIIVASECYEKVKSLGIKIDILIGNDLENLTLQEETKKIATQKDTIEEALKFLIVENYPAVNIISDNFEIKDYVIFHDSINIVVFNKDKKIFPVKSGFSKWKPKGEKIYLLNNSVVKGLSQAGLKKLTEFEYLTEKDGFYTLIFDQLFLYVAEEL